MDPWTAAPLAPAEALARARALARGPSRPAGAADVAAALGLALVFLGEGEPLGAPALFGRLAPADLTAPLVPPRGPTLGLRTPGGGVMFAFFPDASLLDLLAATGLAAAVPAFARAAPLPPPAFHRFAEAVFLGGDPRALGTFCALQARAFAATGRGALLLAFLTLSFAAPPAEDSAQLFTRSRARFEGCDTPKNWADVGFAPLDAALLGMFPAANAAALAAAGVGPDDTLLAPAVALAASRPAVAAALAARGASWAPDWFAARAGYFASPADRALEAFAGNPVELRLAFALRAAGCPAPRFFQTAALLATPDPSDDPAERAAAAAHAEAVAEALAAGPALAAEQIARAFLDPSVAPPAAAALLRRIPPGAAAFEFPEPLAAAIARNRPEAWEALAAVLEEWRAPQLRRAARGLQRGLLEAAFRPGGRGALAAQARFEGAALARRPLP